MEQFLKSPSCASPGCITAAPFTFLTDNGRVKGRTLQSALGDHVSFTVPDGGMSVWTMFQHEDLTTLSKKAYQKGLVIREGKDYDTRTVKYNAVRLGFASLDLK
jgi:DNA-binding transcriptional MocR family regulator